ncbi:dynactin subunit 2 [Leptinotarsa decemlineata]|uniref:dynactin subunit 2 n=1 Tax=Leptinotarsa decemlineata TaxID=7539 RepID=UPI000C2559D1|nr:dynactin subunit 2 [Leptinotarsa decemlineata]
MADPKYADLPGIAHDEPDVYETSDLPESEQSTDFYEEETDPIERIHISTDDAFKKFQGKFLHGENVDFSSRISRKLRTGYDARSGEWELMGHGEMETPIQKYHRLQCEMKELLEEVNDLQNNKNEDDPNCLISSQKVEQSLKQLADLKLEESLGEAIVSKISDPQGVQIKKLLSQLQQFKDGINENMESDIKTDENGIVYQFSYRPEHGRLTQTTRVAELESRLHRLENVLGASSDKLSRLTSATSKGSLLEIAEQLSATASLLDSSKLDHIEGRLGALSQKLDAITEKKKQLQKDDERDKMVLELYQLVKNTENVTKLLPQTIIRLKALEEFHNKAMDLTKTLTQIEVTQAEMSGNVQNNKMLLQGVQESFAMSLNEINSTVVSLDARIKALKKK